ncbi:unnamed protein product [Schistosoma mattheei]|uniref:Uncharacterized protein n=1 Tax=Schistosoma mattheei TaxID=31246 RepID=A0A3P8D155_9TREM|nr:unnamed protein product [Schistosoma mattheei]
MEYVMMSQPAVQKDAIMIYEIDYFVIKAARWTTKSVNLHSGIHVHLNKTIKVIGISSSQHQIKTILPLNHINLNGLV